MATTRCGPAAAACERLSIRDGVNVVIGSVGLLWDDRFTRDLEDGAHHLLLVLVGLCFFLVPWLTGTYLDPRSEWTWTDPGSVGY